MKEKNKGITLIALIITIIVMLILVGVSVSILINSNLIGIAEKTEEEYKTAIEEENSGRVTVEGQTYNSIEEYLAEKTHNWQYTDNTLTELKCKCTQCKKVNETGRIYKIGQQIKLKPSDVLLTDTSTATGSEWVVFGREDSDTDERYETLLITTLAPSTTKLELGGRYGNLIKSADAYNNGIKYIKSKVKEIYGVEARPMTIEDVNRTLGYTPSGGMYYDGSQWQTTGNFTRKLKDLGDIWTNIISNREMFYTPVHPEGISDNGTELGEYILDGYFYTTNRTLSKPEGVPTISETTSSVAKNLVFGTSNSNSFSYWLASRGCYYHPWLGVLFSTGYVGSGYVYSCSGAGIGSGGSTGCRTLSLRAVVPLKSEIPQGGEVLVSQDAWI